MVSVWHMFWSEAIKFQEGIRHDFGLCACHTWILWWSNVAANPFQQQQSCLVAFFWLVILLSAEPLPDHRPWISDRNSFLIFEKVSWSLSGVVSWFPTCQVRSLVFVKVATPSFSVSFFCFFFFFFFSSSSFNSSGSSGWGLDPNSILPALDSGQLRMLWSAPGHELQIASPGCCRARMDPNWCQGEREHQTECEIDCQLRMPEKVPDRMPE